jgi:hypothetical protein
MEAIDPPDKTELLTKIVEYEQFIELKLKPKIKELEKVKVKIDQTVYSMVCAKSFACRYDQFE